MDNEAIAKTLRSALNRARIQVHYDDTMQPPSMRPPVTYDAIRLAESVQTLLDLLEAKNG